MSSNTNMLATRLSSHRSVEIPETTHKTQTVSIVIPVFQGEKTLPRLVQEIVNLNSIPASHEYSALQIIEIFLVWDGAQDKSAEVMKQLSEQYPQVKNVWLSRNFGQHAATLAGVARTRGDWVITLDEDGLHSPEDFHSLLTTALEGNFQLVYGIGSQPAPHSQFRNSTSRIAHWLFKTLLGNEQRHDFSSFRLIRGDVGRSLSAYCGAGVYLDVALQWVTSHSGSCPVTLRKEWRTAKSYNPPRLLGHFRRLVLSSPVSPLRAISLMGLFTIFLSFGLTGYAFYQKITGNVPVQGWTSLFILLSFFFGIIMVSMGIMAEYVGLILSISMGKPLYLVQSKFPQMEKN